MNFKKRLSFLDLSAYGIGIIIGAGIYVLISPGASLVDGNLWLSFLLATLVVLLTGFSYAYLSTKYSFEAAEYFLVKKVTGNKLFSFLVAWMVVTAQIVGISAVSLGFGYYLKTFIGLNALVSAILLIFFVGLVDLVGVDEISRLNIILTSIAVLGLIVVIFSAFFHKIDEPKIGFSFTNMLKGTALVFFSFLGFESIVNLGAESKNAKRNIPLALIVSIIFSGVLYTLVAYSSVKVAGWRMLSTSSAPLALVSLIAFGKIGFWIVELAALFSTASTVLILSLVSSRLLWGLSIDGFLPKQFKKLKNNTPLVSVLFVVILSSFLLILIRKISSIAEIANFNMLLVYTVFNFLLFYHSKKPGIKILGIIAMAATFSLFFFLEKISFVVGLSNIVIGMIIYKLSLRK